MNSTQVKLGQRLIDEKKITPDQLASVLVQQKSSGRKLGELLLDLDILRSEADLLPVLADQMKVGYVQLKGMVIPQEALAAIPVPYVTHFKVFPIDLKDNTLTLATDQPLNIQMLDEINMTVDHALHTVLAGRRDIEEAIRTHYGVGAETINKMMDRADVSESVDTVDDIESPDPEASVSKFFNQILLEAYKDGATDIHIEPYLKELRIRYRIDGVLYDAKTPKDIWRFQDAISSRIKIMSNLDITEKRLPQDGRFKVRVKDIELDLRVSIVPAACGDSIVLRILNSTRLFSLDELGLLGREKDLLLEMTKRPNGIIFLTGPTGSGKTTTLYTCLSRMNTDEHKIITIEDPIEYQLRGIIQLQINAQAGLTFAQGLRSMLRHDPDIMMVGEVRDMETATTAIQVALTGHLIFSTLHTNDASSGVTRLLDMGIEPYLITSTVQCFIAQRLVRRLCEKCKKPVTVTEEVIRELGGEVKFSADETVFEPAGCESCRMTGYNGREAIYEFLILDTDLKKLVLKRASSSEIKDKAVDGGMRTLRQSGWDKVRRGHTTLQEVLRVTSNET